MREAISRALALRDLTPEGVLRELNETLRRKEEARIYHWVHRTGRYPPGREPSPPDGANED